MILGSDHVYDALVIRFVPRILHDELDYEQAMVLIDDLLAKTELQPSEKDFLELITRLVAEYESKLHPIPDVHGIDMLKFLMEQHGLKQKDLIDVFKTPSILSEVLSGKRDLNKSHIEGLARRFHISPSVFFPAS